MEDVLFAHQECQLRVLPTVVRTRLNMAMSDWNVHNPFTLP